MSPTPGPSPGISGVSIGFLQLVSVVVVPGTTSTRPWSSHLWRKERPNSRGHTTGRGKWQGGFYRVEHGGWGCQQLGLLGGWEEHGHTHLVWGRQRALGEEVFWKCPALQGTQW